jgi:hypothetical protein
MEVNMDNLIPIIAIVFGCTFSAVVVIGFFYLIYRISKNRHEERIEMIKSGKVIPVDSIKYTGKRTLYWGFIFSAFGAGVLIIGIVNVIRDIIMNRAYRIDGGDFWGVVPLLIGIGLILFYRYYIKEKKNDTIPENVESHNQ